MGKKSREKKLRREQRKTGRKTSELEFTQFESPFANVPQEKIAELFQHLGREQAELFAQSTEKIEAVVNHVNPLCLLSALATYGLVSGIKADGTIKQILSKKIFPAHIELAHALCLRRPEGDSGAPALGRDLQAAFDTLIDWAEQFHSKRFAQLDDSLPELDRKRLFVQERIRIATQMLRNWGFLGQVKKVANEIVTPLDARFEAKLGFRATQCVAIFDFMFELMMKRIADHWAKIGLMMNAKTLNEAAEQHFKNFPDQTGSPDDLVRVFRERRASLRDAKFMLMSHSDMRLVDVCRFSAKEIGDGLAIPIDVVSRALNAFSLRFGDLRDHQIEHFFLNNPVWTKPVIALKEEGEFFCCMPQSFFAFALDIFLALVRDDEALRDAFDKRRSDYLEESVERQFRDAFPSASITANFKWKSVDKTQEFESDLIVKVDSFLLLVEAKSGRVSPQARRGAPQSLGDDIDDLLVEPSRQSQRLADAILAAKSKAPGTEDFLKGFPVDLNQVHRIVRLSVTLDDVGFLQSNVTDLKEAGYVPQDLVVAPAVTLTDLETVFDILNSEPQRVHYWVRRSEWEATAKYMADELDLLGLYLKSGLDLPSVDSGEYLAMFVGESAAIDEYYEARRNGVTVERPQLQLTDWWRDMLARLEKLKPPRWLEAAVTLLCAGISQQKGIERGVKQIVADVKRRREKAANRNALLSFPGRGRRNGISIVALMASEMEKRHAFLENSAIDAFDNHAEILECVTIALNVDKPTYPYCTLACFRRPDAAT